MKLTDRDDPMLVWNLFCCWIKQKKGSLYILLVTQLVTRQSENDVGYMDSLKSMYLNINFYF